MDFLDDGNVLFARKPMSRRVRENDLIRKETPSYLSDKSRRREDKGKEGKRSQNAIAMTKAR